MPKEGTILKFKTITNRKGFLLSFTLTSSALLNRYNHVIQKKIMMKKVIPNNTKNMNHLDFVTILNASMMRYIHQN